MIIYVYHNEVYGVAKIVALLYSTKLLVVFRSQAASIRRVWSTCIIFIIRSAQIVNANNFPSNPWYDKECKSLKHVLNNIAKHKKFNARQCEYNIMLQQYKQLFQKKEKALPTSQT